MYFESVRTKRSFFQRSVRNFAHGKLQFWSFNTFEKFIYKKNTKGLNYNQISLSRLKILAAKIKIILEIESMWE